MMHFYSGSPMHILSGVDRWRRRCRPIDSPAARGRAHARPSATSGGIPALCYRCVPRPGTTAAGACPDALRPPPSGQRGAPFFEALLGFCVSLRVRGARLLAREPHSAQHPRHARRVITFAEMRRDPVAQIGAGPGATAVTVGLGTPQNHCRQRRFLPFSQPSLRPTLWVIAQPRQILGVVAQHRIAQRLALHPSELRRRGTAHPVKRIGNRIKPRRNPAAPFPPGQPTQLGRRSIFLDLERRPHSSPHIWCELKESRNRCRGNPRVTSTARWYNLVTRWLPTCLLLVAVLIDAVFPAAVDPCKLQGHVDLPISLAGGVPV